MRFDEWMRNKGLSPATVEKYHSAINGTLSNLAREAGLIEGSILDIREQAPMSNLVLKLKLLNIVQEKDIKGHGMYLAALKKYSRFLYDIREYDIEDRLQENDIQEIINDKNIGPTERLSLINARIGQGQYRADMLKIWQRCAVTGYDKPALLTASHIKPWSQSSNAERLDPYNGLLLIPNLDRLFDQGFISFKQDGSILISKSLSDPNILGVKSDMSIKLLPQQYAYMEYHRCYVFKKN